MALTAGTGDYTLSTSIMQIKAVYLTASLTTYQLTQMTVQELLRLRMGTTATGLVSRFAVSGSDLLLVWATPEAADSLTVYYVPRPVTLSAGSDTPSEIPAEFHKAIEFYALAEAADYDDDQSSSQGQRYRDRYLEEVRRYRRNVTLKAGRMPAARVNPRRRNLIPHDPSMDTG